MKDVVAATHQPRDFFGADQLVGFIRLEISDSSSSVSIAQRKSVRIGDIDLDGVMDLVHSTEPNSGPRQPGVTWLKRFADPRLPPRVHPVSDLQGIKFDLLQLIDLDQDGDLDVITCEERDNLDLCGRKTRGDESAGYCC